MRLCQSAAALAILAVLSCPGVAQQIDYCAKCHEKEATSERDLSHFRAGVSCVTCHGGDATQPTKEKAKAEGTGYRGVLDRKTFPSLCGDCHADVRRMNPYGLPTDQLRQYQTSRHGEAFLKEDVLAAATCVDCHGVHGILGSQASESPVNPKNIPGTCGKCHSDPKVVEDAGLEGDEEKLYRRSVHAELLFDKHDLSAPQCATCHGNHGAVPPGFRNVGAVCGKCHVREKELFDQSPHAALVAKGEFNTCVACHQHHEVKPAGKNILQGVCKLCHETGDKGIAVRDDLLTNLDTIHAKFAKTEENLRLALEKGHADEDDLLLLENARTSLTEMRALQHSLNLEMLQQSIKDANQTLDRLQERIDSRTHIEQLKHLFLLPVVAFLALMSFGFWVRFRRIHQMGAHAS